MFPGMSGGKLNASSSASAESKFQDKSANDLGGFSMGLRSPHEAMSASNRSDTTQVTGQFTGMVESVASTLASNPLLIVGGVILGFAWLK